MQSPPESDKQPSWFDRIGHTPLMALGGAALVGGALLTLWDGPRGLLLMLVGLVVGLWGVAVWRESAALKIGVRLMLYLTGLGFGISGFLVGQYIFRNFMFVGFGGILALIEGLDLVRLLTGKGPPPDDPRRQSGGNTEE